MPPRELEERVAASACARSGGALGRVAPLGDALHAPHEAEELAVAVRVARHAPASPGTTPVSPDTRLAGTATSIRFGAGEVQAVHDREELLASDARGRVAG